MCSFCWNFDGFQVNSQKLGVQGCARFTENLSELTKTWSSGATECRVWIGNCNVKVWKSTEHKLHNIWHSVKFQQNEHTPGATECRVWIGNCNVKVWKSTEHQLHKIWRSLKFCTNWGKRAHPRFNLWGVLVLLKLYWAPDIVEFVLGGFSHFYIAITHSNSAFCGAWTPSVCEFTQIFSKTSTPLQKFWFFSNLL